MGTIANVKVEPMSVTWGTDTAQVASITAVADVSDSLDGKYFYIYSASNAIKYHVWFNTSGGSAVDPAPGGSTAVVVALTTNATASAVATATASALDALAGFVSTASGSVITCTNASAGYATEPHDGGAACGFSFDVTTFGNASADVGYIAGDISVKLEEQLADITAHQTGTNVLSQIRTGKSVEVTLTFKETSVAQLRKMFALHSGQSLTPAGANATEVFGWGESRDFSQTLSQAAKLTLHPITLGASDLSRNWTFWKAYPMLDSLTFSGENVHEIPVTFKVYPDSSKNSRIQYFAMGDGTQTLT
jgi:hypothetical protein